LAHGHTYQGHSDRCFICGEIIPKPKKEKKCCDGQAVFSGENHSEECEKPQGWEKEFREKYFNKTPFSGDYFELKKFIKKAIQKTREEVLKEVYESWAIRESPLTPFGEKLWNKLKTKLK
jgi:hypothetical protein